jgi:hypothetical protein
MCVYLFMYLCRKSLEPTRVNVLVARSRGNASEVDALGMPERMPWLGSVHNADIDTPVLLSFLVDWRDDLTKY